MITKFVVQFLYDFGIFNAIVKKTRMHQVKDRVLCPLNPCASFLLSVY